MVYYSHQAIIDLDNIRSGLLEWKIVLSEEFVFSYIDELKNQCESIQHKYLHFNTVYLMHKQFGQKVHKYRRNSNTTWYIIYDLDSYKNIYINKIFSNYVKK